ncbi:DUF3431 domain-containing protein [Aspergillus saccharolyticus JOP 1030-1]|uniref:Uncharacterized protein n=1 Tax=Aspergillus saccharolyticus JOP 1030-1 TaxID=1450539 RepID=A0A318ZLC0_9EURO|nr:hypothetical protein BP01DRAFT_291136 [Aspergillus saccharolyticus JOP 1030-1]PYH47677.1 hypothetical protein BP01DRAFT_291136 [Aspergillus saccharolyticus JOP 1030-1]
MISSRRLVPLLGFAFILSVLFTVYTLSSQWEPLPPPVELSRPVATPSPTPSLRYNLTRTQEESPSRTPYAAKPRFLPGVPKAPGAIYSKILVVPQADGEDTSWIEFELPEWQSAVYAVNDPSAPLHPPKNKGHEVMVYLSYIIEHYDQLPDIIAFMHSHQFAWHNDDLFNGDAAELLRRLNPAWVIRQGYVNLRCTWSPGCPDWLHPGTLVEDQTKQEEVMLARAWGEIFPDDPIPEVLSQPCCAQFAVSRERILAIPRARFVYFRDWMLRTELSDYISGRIWEYLWQVVFTGENVVCVKEHMCYCDGFGICFGGDDEYNEFRDHNTVKSELEEALQGWTVRADLIELTRMHGHLGEESRLTFPEPGKDITLEEQLEFEEALILELFVNATERGQDPKARAAEVGRIGYAPSENQLAGLVEAATAAAGQDVSEWAAAAAVAAAAGAAGNAHHLEGYGPDIHMDDDSFADTSFTTGLNGGRSLRGPGSAAANEHNQTTGLTRVGTKKRKRNEDALDPALTGGAHVGLAGDQQPHHHSHHPQHQQPQQQQQQHPHHYSGEGLDLRGTPPQSLSEARAVGLHSAAALFRQPSSNKKYTRPPMSKLFASLELSPENFLHLQAAAKAYMLDDLHPERRDCVGQRGKGDTEMVKLRLWNCVRHFLEGEGHGERFFGEDVVNEGMGPRTYIWPRDQQKIIALVIPLLRRMVTNERQRQYAVETRKGGGAEERRRRKTEEGLQNLNAHTPTEDHLQLHPQPQHQHHHHQLHDDYTAVQTPMSASQPPLGSTSQTADLGLTELLLDGYSTDWNAFAKSYDMYNQNCELDNLWYLSGLQQPDWRGLVAAIDSHYQVIHNGGYDCPPQCEDANIQRILDANATSDLRWRIGGNIRQPSRNEFASSVTRDISRVIRDTLAVKHEPHGTSHDPASAPQPQHFPPPSNPPMTGSAAVGNARQSTSSMSVSLRINLIQDGKRTHSRLDVPGSQCPDLETLKQVISRRFVGQLPGFSTESGLDSASGWASGINWKLKVWLPDGLTSVQNDDDWAIALLSAGNVDWMDDELRVLVEFEEAS